MRTHRRLVLVIVVSSICLVALFRLPARRQRHHALHIEQCLAEVENLLVVENERMSDACDRRYDHVLTAFLKSVGTRSLTPQDEELLVLILASGLSKAGAMISSNEWAGPDPKPDGWSPGEFLRGSGLLVPAAVLFEGFRSGEALTYGHLCTIRSLTGQGSRPSQRSVASYFRRCHAYEYRVGSVFTDVCFGGDLPKTMLRLKSFATMALEAMEHYDIHAVPILPPGALYPTTVPPAALKEWMETCLPRGFPTTVTPHLLKEWVAAFCRPVRLVYPTRVVQMDDEPVSMAITGTTCSFGDLEDFLTRRPPEYVYLRPSYEKANVDQLKRAARTPGSSDLNGLLNSTVHALASRAIGDTYRDSPEEAKRLVRTSASWYLKQATGLGNTSDDELVDSMLEASGISPEQAGFARTTAKDLLMVGKASSGDLEALRQLQGSKLFDHSRWNRLTAEITAAGLCADDE